LVSSSSGADPVFAVATDLKGEKKSMKLRFNPLQVFESGKTPACLYARKKWLAESGTRQWKNDFQETVSSLLADQGSDGSWNQSEVAKITRLFGLHLTVRETSAKIEAALNWLVGKIELYFE
jgi:hypothetical protein